VTDTATSIFDTIGGHAAVEAVVDELYRRVLADPVLAPYFADTDMDTLRRHQRAFITAALGGPGTLRARPMVNAHAGRRISDDAFDRVITHLVAIVRDAGVDEHTIDQIGQTLAPLRPHIVERDAATG
jgi:hemoglobin